MNNPYFVFQSYAVLAAGLSYAGLFVMWSLYWRHDMPQQTIPNNLNFVVAIIAAVGVVYAGKALKLSIEAESMVHVSGVLALIFLLALNLTCILLTVVALFVENKT